MICNSEFVTEYSSLSAIGTILKMKSDNCVYIGHNYFTHDDRCESIIIIDNNHPLVFSHPVRSSPSSLRLMATCQ